MDELKNQRKQLKSRLTRLKNKYNEFFTKSKEVSLNSSEINQLKSRLKDFEPSLKEFESIHQHIINISDDEIHETELEAFENSYYEIISDVSTFLNNITGQPNSENKNANSVPNSQAACNSVQLPSVSLPSFNGDFNDWVEFHDTFNSLIHENNTLSSIQKFYYLTSCLKGEALQAIKSLKVSTENYDIAWSILKKRFENKKLIIQNNLKSLFNLEHIKKDSHILLQRFLDNIIKITESLNNYDQPSKDTLLIYIITAKFSAATRYEWETLKYKDEFPTFKELISFLENRCNFLCSIEMNTNQQNNLLSHANNNYNHKSHKHNSNAFVSTYTHNCNFCKNAHLIKDCQSFLKLNVNDRIKEIKKLHLCINCLKKGHSVVDCRAGMCKRCNKEHHTLLHINFNNQILKADGLNSQNNSNSNPNNESSNDDSLEKPQQVTFANHALNSGTQQTLLSTARIQVYDASGKLHTARALLDPGSQSNFISEDFYNILGLNKTKLNLTVCGINQHLSNIQFRTEIKFKSNVNDFTATISCHIINLITDLLPSKPFDLTSFNIPNHIRLADNKCNIPGKIDILLGAGIFWDLLCIGQHKLGKNYPLLQKTKLGWVLGGNYKENHNTVAKCKQVSNCYSSFLNDKLNDKIEKFWNIEELDSINNHNYSSEELFCEEHFQNNTTRDNSGRFVVRLPLKSDSSVLGDSRNQALSRFSSLERKLNNNSKFKNEYVQFMSEYQNLGHMSKVLNENDLLEPKYYIPHHGVTKLTSSTTKLRVVFDASAKTTTNISLNDIQAVGPTIQSDLFSILLRFRRHNIVLTADIAKMYRQVSVNESDRNLQLIFWRENPDQPMGCYRLNTVTYGMASASFLSIRCLKQLATDFRNIYPRARKIIDEDFYVDDLITGFNSQSEAVEIQNEIVKILDSACFQLRKWTSNDKSILEKLNLAANLEQNIINFSDMTESKTLGIFWKTMLDNFQYSFCGIVSNKSQITKRSILSKIAQIYDPLGLISPLVINAKLIMQQLWLLKISWDESVPFDLHTEWFNYLKQLDSLNTLSIPRQVICKNSKFVELHGFSDASERAYGACIYLRSSDNQNTFASLLCSKSRVAPLKTITLPRLELCGAVLLAQLYKRVSKLLQLNLQKCIFWCDSTIVLNWINSSPNKYKTFVSNRISEIQRCTEIKNWRHVRSSDNPADLVSRGIEFKRLLNCSLWWHGPSWLRSNSVENWPREFKSTEIDCDARVVVNLVTQRCDSDIFNNFSSFTKLQRIVAYCLRFVCNTKHTRDTRQIGYLTLGELNNSLNTLIKLAQGNQYYNEIHNLKAGKSLSPKDKLLQLNPFLDKNGILRVGGRIQNSQFDFQKKHPVILPPKHVFTRLLFKYEHIRMLHCGPNLLLASIRDKFWPISGKNIAKRTVFECITCFRAKPKMLANIMGSLPKQRLEPAPPFFNCGIDYAGPVLIKNKRGRGAKLQKAYITLFVCFSTKAIHLDLVTDLKSDSFISVLRRFVSRRGRPHNIFSDNGTTFVGANSEIKELFEFLKGETLRNKINNFSNENSIVWHFIPPMSPHFGGLWEAGVKSAKTHIKRVAGNTNFDFEDFYTLLTQVEAVLNSRPLTPLSTNPDDVEPLTPAHFLIGRKLTTLPEESVSEIPTNRLDHYQLVQKTVQHFWKRWCKEYIQSLQIRNKWKSTSQNHIMVGDLVVLHEENTAPSQWRLGRVTQLHPGQDGIVRVVSLKTKGGVLKRSIVKLGVLPINI